jgi:hypothetical protein
MPGDRHDGFAEMFERRPALVRALLGAAAALLPEDAPVRVVSNEFSHYKPTNYHADRVLIFGSPPDEVAVIIEIQRWYREEKLRIWPFYVTSLWARHGYPVILLVLCDDAKTAALYDKPIRIGRAAVVRPDVVGPDRVPVVRDAQLARDLPELAVISAILHHDRPGSDQIFQAFAAALMTVGTELGRLYYDLVFAELPEPRRPHLQEVVMSTITSPYRSDYNRTLYLAGAADGEAKAVLTVLEARGFTPSEAERDRIRECTDLDQLEAWLRRVGTITTIEELFS